MAVRLSPTLSYYIGRHFLTGFFGLFFVFMLLILMFDTIELMRRAASESHITFPAIVQMALLKLPNMGQQLFPFGALFGAMIVFWRLTRHHELVVTRAAGVSAWQFMLPVLALAFLLGVVKITVYNPFAAALLSRFERIEAAKYEGQASLLAISNSGLWLRQAGDYGQAVVHAKHVLQQADEVELSDVIVFQYHGVSEFKDRIDAAHARLEGGYWLLEDAWISVPEQLPTFEAEYRIPTNLTLEKIQDSFAPPETMSFWDLPDFIQTLERAGFSAVRHRLHWHALLATPLLMCAMVLIAATFTLRQARRGGTTLIVIGGVLTGFAVYLFSDIVFALGLSNSIPVTLSAWTPSGVATLLGIAMMLHLEDG